MAMALVTTVGLNLWLEPSAGDEPDPWSDAWEGLRPSAVDGLRLLGAGPAVSLQRTPGAWQLLTPESGAADVRRVDQLVESISRLSIGPALEIENLDEFGLETPRRTLSLSGGGEPLADLDIGRRAPAGTGTYVQIEGAVHMTRFPLGEAVDADWTFFRTREVLRFPRTAVTAIHITGSDPSVHLVRSSAGWQLSGPEPGPADAAKAQAFLDALHELRVEAHGASAGVPLDEREVRLETPDGDTTLQVWRQQERWWAIGPLHRGPVEITPGLAPMLLQAPAYWAQAPSETD
jgi:hypothetical protein